MWEVATITFIKLVHNLTCLCVFSREVVWFISGFAWRQFCYMVLVWKQHGGVCHFFYLQRGRQLLLLLLNYCITWLVPLLFQHYVFFGLFDHAIEVVVHKCFLFKTWQVTTTMFLNLCIAWFFVVVATSFVWFVLAWKRGGDVWNFFCLEHGITTTNV